MQFIDLHFGMIWFLGTLAIFMISSFFAGFLTEFSKIEKEKLITASFACGVIWPCILVATAVCGIFFAIYKFGEYIRQRIQNPLA